MTSSEPPNSGTWQSTASAESVCGAFKTAFDQLGRALSPQENVERHFREARKQVLLGIREMIDNRLQEMSRNETKGTRVMAE